PVEAIESAHRLRLLHGHRAAACREAGDVGIHEIAGRQLDDDERHHRDGPGRGEGKQEAAHDESNHALPPLRLLHPLLRVAAMSQSLKNQVSGCEPPGVRQCWAMQTREGMLPSLFDAMRTPISPGDWPTVPMPYCWSAMIFQMSCAILMRSASCLPAAEPYSA